MLTAIRPTDLQSRILAYRGRCGILSGGGRGGGKSHALLLDVVDHAQDPDARILILRESHAGLTELAEKLHELAVATFGEGVSRNLQRGEVRFPSGSIAYLSNLDDAGSYRKVQGRSFSMIAADELGNYSEHGYAMFRRTLSNLRAAPGKETRVHCTANPGGASHARVLRDYVDGRAPWRPFRDRHGLWWVLCESTLRDNPELDREAYERNVLASAGGDPDLARAWIAGDWSTIGGSLFAPPWDSRVHVFRGKPHPQVWFDRRLRLVVAADWGTASPSAALLVLQLGVACIDRFRSRDIVVLDETDTATEGDLTRGIGRGVGAWAEQIREMLSRWNLPRRTVVVSDDAKGLGSESVIAEMRAEGLNARQPSRKDRPGTWAILRGLLHGAGERGGRRGIFVSDRCQHLIATLPEAPRSAVNPRDIDARWRPDHWVDALGYGISFLHRRDVGAKRRSYN